MQTQDPYRLPGEPTVIRLTPKEGCGPYYEYRSGRTWLGLPLVHIALGKHPETGRRTRPKGVIAIGLIARGIVPIGLVGIGVLPIAQLGIGICGLCQLFIGVIGLGQISICATLALGQIAIGWWSVGQFAFGMWSMGQFAFGPHPVGLNALDAQGLQFWREYLPWLADAIQEAFHAKHGGG